MDYGESLRQVLIRKINKAERDLYQLKMDYCRFVFGISHRSKVYLNDQIYQVKAVDLDSMTRSESGEWTKPRVSGVVIDSKPGMLSDEVVQIGCDWELVA
jgi:hypothetical protein